MPRVERSPPAAPSTTEKQQMFETPHKSNQQESEHSNVTARNKRLRPNFSPESEWTITFENKIMKLLNSWKKDQDIMLNKLTSDIAEVKQQNIEIQNTNNEIEKSIEFINSGYENMRQLIERLDKERMEQRNYILELEKKIMDLQNSSRSSAIEIRNVPQRENETICDLKSTILKTCKAIQTTVNDSELRDVYRIPGKKGTNRPIVCEFTTVPLKHQVLEASRVFNKERPLAEKLNTEHIGHSGPRTSIFIAEHLPGSLRQLFYETRNFARNNNFKFCWTHNGRLFLREREGTEAINIKTPLCLKKLLNQKCK